LLEEVKRQAASEESARRALKRKIESAASLSVSRSHSHLTALSPGQFRVCRSESSIENMVKTTDERDTDVILIDDDDDADDADDAELEGKRPLRSTRSCKIARRLCNQGVSYAELSLSEESSGAEDNSRISLPGDELCAVKTYSLKKPDAKQKSSRLRFALSCCHLTFHVSISDLRVNSRPTRRQF
jgi:hypothetical protein